MEDCFGNLCELPKIKRWLKGFFCNYASSHGVDKSLLLMLQGMGAEENAAQSVSDSCTDVADASAPQIRRSARFRKRRRM